MNPIGSDIWIDNHISAAYKCGTITSPNSNKTEIVILLHESISSAYLLFELENHVSISAVKFKNKFSVEQKKNRFSLLLSLYFILSRLAKIWFEVFFTEIFIKFLWLVSLSFALNILFWVQLSLRSLILSVLNSLWRLNKITSLDLCIFWHTNDIF